MSGRTLVTGAAGFIGSHLVDSLCADGISPLSFDLPGVDFSNLRDSDSEIVHGDIRNPADLDRAMRGVETVYHLAAISRHNASLPDSEYHAINVQGTRNVLDAAIRIGLRRVVFVATIEAVGMSRTSVLAEKAI